MKTNKQSKKIKPADVRVDNHGSVCLVTPLTEVALTWVAENIQLESWQWIGGGFSAEPRYIDNLVEGMRGDGLTVTV